MITMNAEFFGTWMLFYTVSAVLFGFLAGWTARRLLSESR